MSWAKLDDRWPTHRKSVLAGPLARDLYVCGLCYCNGHLTDGFIPEQSVPSLAPGQAKPRLAAQRLVEVGLWERVDGGYRVHDYHDWNPSSQEVREKRDAKRERQYRWRSRRDERPSTPPSRSTSNDASRDAAPTPTPTPTPLPPLSTDASRARTNGRPGLPPELFNADCPDRRWLTPKPSCVNAAFAAAHPDLRGTYPVRDHLGTPKQCPHHAALRAIG